jgi:hypothetical protein
MNNLVKNNCFWATHPNKYYNENGGILPGAVGFEAYNNVIADPEYVDCQAKKFSAVGGQPLPEHPRSCTASFRLTVIVR